MPADPESPAGKLPAGEHRRLRRIAEAAEVHLPEGGGLDVLEAERQVRIGQRIGLPDGGGREVRNQVARVEQRLAVVLVVDDAASLVRRHRVHET